MGATWLGWCAVWIEPLWNWNFSPLFILIILSLQVWIEPLWNWNSKLVERSVKLETFELNLYGIEIRHRQMHRPVLARFELNLYGIEMTLWRHWAAMSTQFELNLYGIEIAASCEQELPQSCLNWTFMELKLDFLACWALNLRVWIEPLWNWNSATKYVINSHGIVWIEPLWNWNLANNAYFRKASGLNWTFMELKCFRFAW